MMKYCRYPSTRQYDVVAAKLIETFGVLKDCDGTGSVRFSNNGIIRNMIHMFDLKIGMLYSYRCLGQIC